MTFLAPKKSQTLTPVEAAHLIRRCGFGATPEQLELAVATGLEKTVDRFFEQQTENSNLQHLDQGITPYLGMDKIQPLATWWLMRMVLTKNPLFEKMTLFWHGHFATSDRKVQSPRLMHQQTSIFRQDPFGSFGALLQKITKDPAMVYWLDNNTNSKEQPNENFAREVMELFSLGIGNYTEKDIQEAARAFTGWFVRDKEFRFSPRSHDTGTKTIFGETGAFKGEDVIALCVKQAASKRFLAKKLLSFFVNPHPPKAAIEAMAFILEENNFAFDLALKTVFKSEWFFSKANRRVLIRSPIDLVVGTIRLFDLKVDMNQAENLTGVMGQSLFEPPNVKGWDGDRLWINAATLLARQKMANHVAQQIEQGTLTSFLQGTPEEIVNRLCNLLVPGVVLQPVRNKLIAYLAKANGKKAQYVTGVIEAIMTLPEYQVA